MTVIHSETWPGPGGHSRKVADGESKDTRTRCGGSKGKPSNGNPTDFLFALVPFSTFLVLTLILCGCHGHICFRYHNTFLDQKFIGTINQRLERIQETVGRTLPAIKEPGQSLHLLSFLDKPGR